MKTEYFVQIPFFKDSASVIYEKVTLYNEDGSLKEYTIYEESQTITYYPDGTPKQLVELDQNGKTKKSTNYNPDGSVKTYTIGNISYYPNGNKYSVTEYVTPYGRAIKYYTIDGEYDGCTIYQDTGNWMSITKYDAEGNIISVDGYSTVSPVKHQKRTLTGAFSILFNYFSYTPSQQRPYHLQVYPSEASGT